MGETRKTLSLSMSDDRTRSAPPAENGSGAPVNGSKADFKTLITDLIDPIIILNRLGTICFTNPAAKELLKNGLGPRVEEYFKKHTNQKAQNQVRFRLNNGSDVILKMVRHHIQWIGKPAVLVSIQDVTQYVKTAAKMRNSNQRTLSLLERVTDASYIIDVGEGAIPPYLSPQFDDLIGSERSSWNNEPLLWRKFIHEDDRPMVVKNVAQAIRERKPFAAEYRLHTHNGNMIWIREKAQVIEEADSDLIILSGFLSDITKEKDAVAAAAASVERAAEQEHLAQLERALAAARKAQTALQEERDQLDEILKKRTAAFSAESQQAADAASQLQTRNTELESSLKALEARRGELDEQLKQRTSDTEKLDERLAAETTAREQVEAEVKKLQQRLAEAEQTAAELKSARERAEAERDQHAAALAAANEKMTRQAAEQEEAATSGDALHQRLVEADQVIEELRAERAEFEASRDERIGELEKARDELQQELAVSAKAVEDLKTSQRHLKDQWDRRAGQLKKESESLRQELAEARRMAEEAETARADIEDKTNQTIADLEKSHQQLEGDLAKSQTLEEEARASCDRLKAELKQHRNDLKKAQRKLSLRADAAKRAENTLHEYRARFEDWAKKSAAELRMASEHLRHELPEEAQNEDQPESS